jgi:hypothetical protein
MEADELKKKSNLESLLDEILAKSIKPQDMYEIAALLESIGWNDKRASQTFGVQDIFELAEVLWNMMKGRASFESYVGEEKVGIATSFLIIVKSFLRGMIFALPMGISVIAMLTLRFSLWSYENLSTELATCIAIGTILSFMSIGGFTQAIARRGFFYINQGYYNMAKRVTYYFLKLGYLFCAIIALAFFIFNLFFEIFPTNLMIVILVFYMFLSSIWLAVTVMYILKREFTFTALITAGIGIVFIFFKVFNFNILVSQVIALLFISILGLFLVIYFFNQAEKKMEKGISPELPRNSIMLYSLMPFFIYGFLYFTFLFADRVIAWSTNDVFMPYLIWFRGGYELGLDFALLMMIVPLGTSEVIVSRLMVRLENAQKNSLSHDIETLNKKYLNLYSRSLITVSIVSAISGILIFLALILLRNGYGPSIINKALLSNSVMLFVFIFALISYAVLSVALTNVIVLFSLSVPDLVTKAILRSLIINVIVGFLLTRWIGYQYAVFGLLAGSIFFMIYSTICVIKVLRNLDYYIYAAL